MVLCLLVELEHFLKCITSFLWIFFSNGKIIHICSNILITKLTSELELLSLPVPEIYPTVINTILNVVLTKIKTSSHTFAQCQKSTKNLWTFCPIVSYCVSISYGLGKWFDKQLQPLVIDLLTYLSSSFELQELLLSTNNLQDFSHLSLFTCDA